MNPVRCQISAQLYCYYKIRDQTDPSTRKSVSKGLHSSGGFLHRYQISIPVVEGMFGALL